jgi:3-methylcrotonyl-CoA carboxylase alpha subunit
LRGARPIRRLLVANRGEIAVRIVRACRALGIEPVAVFSEPDREARHVRLAREAVPIGPAPAKESYLHADRLLAAAKSTGCDAVHPGYGFLSENAGFARAVEAAGFVWVGPPASVIEAMGSKISSRERMKAAGVPVVPGSHVIGERPGIPSSERESGNREPRGFSSKGRESGARHSTSGLATGAARAVSPPFEEVLSLGFPVVVKASAGGGGKGMRVVASPDELPSALESCRREAAAAFDDWAT